VRRSNAVCVGKTESDEITGVNHAQADVHGILIDY
jgi:hypothetical protein